MIGHRIDMSRPRRCERKFRLSVATIQRNKKQTLSGGQTPAGRQLFGEKM